MNGFPCPRCGARSWGEITRGNGEKAQACHGIRRYPDGTQRSCDFEIPTVASEQARTPDQLAAAVAELRLAHEQVGNALAQLKPDDEFTMREIEYSYGSLQGTLVRMIDDAVSARQERERQEAAAKAGAT